MGLIAQYEALRGELNALGDELDKARRCFVEKQKLYDEKHYAFEHFNVPVDIVAGGKTYSLKCNVSIATLSGPEGRVFAYLTYNKEKDEILVKLHNAYGLELNSVLDMQAVVAATQVYREKL